MVLINTFLYCFFFLSQRDQLIESFQIANLLDCKDLVKCKLLYWKIILKVPIAGSFLLSQTLQKHLSLGDLMHVTRVLL